MTACYVIIYLIPNSLYLTQELRDILSHREPNEAIQMLMLSQRVLEARYSTTRFPYRTPVLHKTPTEKGTYSQHDVLSNVHVLCL